MEFPLAVCMLEFCIVELASYGCVGWKQENMSFQQLDQAAETEISLFSVRLVRELGVVGDAAITVHKRFVCLRLGLRIGG